MLASPSALLPRVLMVFLFFGCLLFLPPSLFLTLVVCSYVISMYYIPNLLCLFYPYCHTMDVAHEKVRANFQRTWSNTVTVTVAFKLMNPTRQWHPNLYRFITCIVCSGVLSTTKPHLSLIQPFQYLADCQFSDQCTASHRIFNSHQKKMDQKISVQYSSHIK